MRRWLKREMLVAGRQRVIASMILFWGPILLAALLVFAVWLTAAILL